MTTSLPYLHASAPTTAAGTLSLRAEAAIVEGVDHGRRIITGLCVPFGVPGRTNLGHGLSVRAGAVRFREPHRRVIGVWGHTTPPGEQPRGWPEGSPVSRMVAYEATPEGLRMQLRAARTPLGDQLLAEADPEDGVRSSLSIELVDVSIDQWTAEIIDGLCEFVGHVPLGAYDDARVTSVAASLHQLTPEGDDVRRRLAIRSPFSREFINVGGGGQTGAQPQQQQQGQPQQQQQGQPQQQQAPVYPLQGQPQQQHQLQAQQAPIDWAGMAAFAQANAMLQQGQPQVPAVLPQAPYLLAQPSPAPGFPAPAGGPLGIPTQALPPVQQQSPQGGQQSPRDAVRRMAQLQAAVFQSGGNVSGELRAALADITNTGLDMFQNPAGAIGEQLWSGEGDYQRRYTGLMRQKELTSWKGTGWQWTVKPKVAAYAGDKAEIPTNVVAVEPSEWVARRAAGGWDIDRKFIDFGDAAFWEGFYQAQTDSYRELTDEWAIAAIVAAARDITLDANVPTSYQGVNVAQADIFRGVGLGNAILEDTKNVKRSAEYVLMNTQDWLTLLNFTNLDLPSFLALLNIKPENFMRSPDVPAGAITMGVKPAMTFRELGNGAPIRVEALDVAKAGVDSAVYGYVSYSLDRPGGVISVPLVAPAP